MDDFFHQIFWLLFFWTRLCQYPGNHASPFTEFLEFFPAHFSLTLTLKNFLNHLPYRLPCSRLLGLRWTDLNPDTNHVRQTSYKFRPSPFVKDMNLLQQIPKPLFLHQARLQDIFCLPVLPFDITADFLRQIDPFFIISVCISSDLLDGLSRIHLF